MSRFFLNMTEFVLNMTGFFPKLTMQNSALSKQSAAVNTICFIMTIKADGELGKVKEIKSYLQCVEGAGPEVIQYIAYYI